MWTWRDDLKMVVEFAGLGLVALLILPWVILGAFKLGLVGLFLGYARFVAQVLS